MRRGSESLWRRYLRERLRSIEARPSLFRRYIEELARHLGGRASVILFGGRARAGIDAVEPRDYDILLVVDEGVDPEYVEDTAYKLKPRGLPVDIVVVRRSELRDPVIQRMLSNHLVLHDPLGLRELGNTREIEKSSKSPREPRHGGNHAP